MAKKSSNSGLLMLMFIVLMAILVAVVYLGANYKNSNTKIFTLPTINSNPFYHHRHHRNNNNSVHHVKYSIL